MPRPAGLSAHVTLKDVARVAAVHFSTVSLALRDHPGLAPATRERVRGIARSLGYRRDPVNQALTARRVGGPCPRPRLVFLTNRRGPEEFSNTPHMPAFLAGAREQALSMGYDCELMLAGEESPAPADLEHRLRAADASGLIIAAWLPGARRVRFDWSRHRVVKIDSASIAPDADLVTHDQFHAVRLAYRSLHTLGYRRIGLAVGLADETNTRDLYSAGRLLEQERLGLAPIPPLHFGVRESYPTSLARLERWIRRHQLDVVLSNWRSIADTLAHAGFRTPADVACACLSLDSAGPPLAGVIENHHLVGRKAAETLALLLQGGSGTGLASPSATYIAGAWQDGPGAPPRTPASP